MGFLREDKMHILRADRLAWDAARTKLLSPAAKLRVARLVYDALRIRRVLSYEDLWLAGAFDPETPEAYCTRLGLGQELDDLDRRVLLPLAEGPRHQAVRVQARLLVVPRAAGRSARRPPRQRARGGGDRRRRTDQLGRSRWSPDDFVLSQPPNVDPAFVVVPRPVSDGIFAAVLEHNEAPDRTPPGKGLVTLYGMNEWTVRHMDEDDDTVIASILRDGERIIPGLGNDIEFARVNRWYPVLVYSHPGLYRELGKFHASRPITRRSIWPAPTTPPATSTRPRPRASAPPANCCRRSGFPPARRRWPAPRLAASHLAGPPVGGEGA